MPPEAISWLISSWIFCPPRAASAAAGMLKRLKLVRDVQPDVPHVGVAYLEDFQVEHHFRPGTIQLSEKLGCGFQRCLAVRAA